MKERVYVDRLFAEYEDTPEIGDFKEEIVSNLIERVKELAAKGLDEETAFDKAAAELGDITAIADEVGKKKRNEAIGQMYMKSKVPLTKKTAGGVTAATGLLLLGVGMMLMRLFSNTGGVGIYYLSALLLSVSTGLFVYFSLTQETAARYAMKNRRALAYGAVCLFGFAGASFAVVSFLFNDVEISSALGMKVAFILPAICTLIFLLATEKKRQKPWFMAMMESYSDSYFVDFSKYQGIVNPVRAARFGVLSGGLWILAAAIFLTISFTISWSLSWIVFVFAAAIQVFMVAMIFEKKK